jgi:hypothetical protein
VADSLTVHLKESVEKVEQKSENYRMIEKDKPNPEYARLVGVADKVNETSSSDELGGRSQSVRSNS